jgi:hypothetical protein
MKCNVSYRSRNESRHYETNYVRGVILPVEITRTLAGFVPDISSSLSMLKNTEDNIQYM